MASIIYKTLFKVQILHEYYLTNSDETTIFDNLNNKESFLSNNFTRNLPSVSNDLSYEIPQAIQEMFSNSHLRLITDYMGFSILTEVKQNVLDDGTIVYKPLVQLSPTTNIIVQLTGKNNLVANVTNKRINKNIPAIYYFTNEDIPSAKSFPVLSADIPVYDSTYTYEQGELYTDSSGQISLFYLNGSNPGFLPVAGNGYANINDEILVPLQFTYRFNASDSVTKVVFELKDYTGKTVRNYTFASTIPIKNQFINFSYDQNPAKVDPPVDPIACLPLSDVSAKNIYDLFVTLNNNNNPILQKLIFFDGDANPLSGCWGIVNIKPQVANSEFNLYDADGLILNRRKTDGTEIPAPVFELRIKSRYCFWRYINDRNAVLKVDAGSPFLQRDGTNNLASKLPRNASALPRMFTIKDNTGKITEEEFLPNPEEESQVIIEGQKFYKDILVPQSSMFPVDTS